MTEGLYVRLGICTPITAFVFGIWTPIAQILDFSLDQE